MHTVPGTFSSASEENNDSENIIQGYLILYVPRLSLSDLK